MRFRTRPGLLEEEIDDDVVLYDPGREEVTVLNATAGDIWRLCDGSFTLEEMVKRLSQAYATPEEVIRRDVERTVRDLVDKGLLVET